MTPLRFLEICLRVLSSEPGMLADEVEILNIQFFVSCKLCLAMIFLGSIAWDFFPGPHIGVAGWMTAAGIRRLMAEARPDSTAPNGCRIMALIPVICVFFDRLSVRVRNVDGAMNK